MLRSTFLGLLLCATPMAGGGPQLLQKPALNATHIVFVYAGDLWSVPRGGGNAIRLTTGPGLETEPAFSPDGKLVAFTGEYDGNTDVFVIPASGGVPRRLTSHPAPDRSAGWTPDGKRVLFRSPRHTHNYPSRLFTVPVEGGFPEELPLPIAEGGSYSPDATRIAYMPLGRANEAWKRYRGGRATPIWIARLSDSEIVKIPRKDSNDFNPMWVGERIYFLSDRNGSTTLFRYDVKSQAVEQVLENNGLDLKSAAAGPGAIVYEQFGSIHLYDLKSGRTQAVPITVSGDLPAVRPRLERVNTMITSAAPSPSGVRALFEARGEIFTAPVEKGAIRNITGTPGVAERDPAWSPDGQWIAYFSDASGEYELHVRRQNGIGDVKKIALGKPATFYYAPTWSPDGKKIAFLDKRITLWYVDLEKGEPVKVDTGTYHESHYYMQPRWSPDSKWLAYARHLKNRLCAIKLYSLESGVATQVTDGMSDARFPDWDPNGKYLYFAASTDSGPVMGGLDLSSFNRPVSRNLYLMVLSKEDPSPLAPESDEEKEADANEEKKPEKKDEKKAVVVRVDLDEIGQRIVALPLPPRNYARLGVGKTGIVFVLEAPPISAGPVAAGPRVLQRFDLDKRKAEKFLEDVQTFDVSQNGEKLLYRSTKGPQYYMVATAVPPKPGDGALKLEEMETWIDPQAEWRQMYREVWRIERDFFYDPNHHGLNLQAAAERYERYLDNLGHRADLNYLFQEMLGELTVGHLYVGGGDIPKPKQVKGGLLGADYQIDSGRYKIARIYTGESWNPEAKAPLTQPGVNVRVGDYILAVNGRELRGTDEIYSFFEGTAEKPVVLKVSADATGASSREVTVVPVENESGLRVLAWIEENRRKVDKLSGGKFAYIHLPDTGAGGYTYFNRYYFAQTDKQGAVIDERFNRGGKAADYIIDHLKRPLLNFWTSRDGEDYTTPATAIFGPKAMIVNEYAGSGGDLLPWYFRRTGLGPLIGKRTWGGLVGIGGYPTLIDGGSVTAPHFAFWNPDGKWEVENYGTAPDIEVELDPKAWRQGRDPQLEKAVEVLMEELRKSPPPVRNKPIYPNYHKSTRVRGNGREAIINVNG